MITIYTYNKASKLLSYRDSGLIDSLISDIPEGYDFTLTSPPDMSNKYKWNGLEWEKLPEDIPSPRYKETQ